MLNQPNQQDNQCQDIFDKFIMLPILSPFFPFYKRHKEIFLYLFFGGITFFLNLGLFGSIDSFTDINELINNVICWVICVIFQFITNRTWVFNGAVNGAKAFLSQLAAFFGGRVFTLILEEAIIAIFITWLGWKAIIVKLVAQLIVIILNYVISKWIVFRNQTELF
ncbi:MAG: GtrA family protein [Lachnospiraceae bacterium]|nr:GtrA family protein [Lachnospiraceae bacterium]